MVFQGFERLYLVIEEVLFALVEGLQRKLIPLIGNAIRKCTRQIGV
jgi:hypothetical protein